MSTPSSQIFASRSRNLSPIHVSTPLNSQSTPKINPVFQSNKSTSAVVIRSSSVSPFKRIQGRVLSNVNNEYVQNNEIGLFWKNKYESLQMIYQLEIEELRKFYASHSNHNHRIPHNVTALNEEINLMKKDNRILSEFIKKNQEEIESLTVENTELKRKLAEISLTIEKVDDLIEKNKQLNALTERRSDELAQLLIQNESLQEIAIAKSDEIQHLKNLVSKLIQDHENLSELVEGLKKENSDFTNEIKLANQQIEEKVEQKLTLEKELHDLRYLNNELNTQLSLKFKEESIKEKPDSMSNNDDMGNNDFEVLLESFNELKEENYKLKQELQGYYGDMLLMREREKMLKLELEKSRKEMESLRNQKKESLSKERIK